MILEHTTRHDPYDNTAQRAPNSESPWFSNSDDVYHELVDNLCQTDIIRKPV